MTQVHFQLKTLKKGLDTIVVYYQCAKLLSDDTLAASGKTPSPIEFITFLLAGLGIDYESVVTSITTRVDPLNLI